MMVSQAIIKCRQPNHYQPLTLFLSSITNQRKTQPRTCTVPGCVGFKFCLFLQNRGSINFTAEVTLLKLIQTKFECYSLHPLQNLGQDHQSVDELDEFSEERSRMTIITHAKPVTSHFLGSHDAIIKIFNVLHPANCGF